MSGAALRGSQALCAWVRLQYQINICCSGQAKAEEAERRRVQKREEVEEEERRLRLAQLPKKQKGVAK